MKNLSTAALLSILAAATPLGCGTSTGGTGMGGSGGSGSGGTGSGGTSGGGTSSGVPRATTAGTLTAAQAGTFCDWRNAKEGGYNRFVACSDGSTQVTDMDKASCESTTRVLGAICSTLTVGDLEDCANAVGTDLCSITTKTGCAAFNACVSSVN